MEKSGSDDQLLKQFPFWKCLTEDEKNMVRCRRHIMKYQIGQILCGGSVGCPGVLLVTGGVLRTYLLSQNGKEITIYRLRTGEVCVMAASCVLHSISLDTHVEAETDSEVILIPIELFSLLIEQNIHVRAISYQMVTERFSDVVKGMERLVFMNLEQRLVTFLLEEATEENSDTIYMTHEQIAVSIGSAREAVSRTLKSLAHHGWVDLFRGGVTIRDKRVLHELLG